MENKIILAKQKALWYIIFIQSLVATLGSLYFSTYGDPVKNIMNGNIFPYGEGLVPCLLCWFARILMYPIVFISAVGIIKKDKNFTHYILPLTIPGILLELYHYYIQKFPNVSIQPCSLNNPCTALQVNYFGFITIPFLCLVAFLIIFTCILINEKYNRKAHKA